jgi:SAM-dependent MidA family methyltransferase
MDFRTSVLSDFIRDVIHRSGPVPFRWFMEQALYHPEHGYYSSGRCSIGRHGDYFTNVSVGPLFGQILAAQFAEIWEHLGCPPQFTILEQGAHNADFARDVLEAARKRAPEFFAVLHYQIIEPFSILQTRQAAALNAFRDKVEWRKSVNALDPFCGVHFSNELLDAMPVHLITAKGSGLNAATKSKWQEKYVTATSGGFEFVDGPLSTAGLQDHLSKISVPPNNDYKTEVNLTALEWIEVLSGKLERGYVLAVDYGYSRDEFYAPERSSGTLQCYANHRLVSSPLSDPGNIDITAHVDWTSLAEQAEGCDLRVAGFADQHHFMSGIVANLLEGEFSSSASENRRALQTLLHPGLLGRAFQFLALAKGISEALPFSGFKFARNPRITLGLTAA